MGVHDVLQSAWAHPGDVVTQSGRVLQDLQARGHEQSAAVEEQLTVALGLGAGWLGEVAGQDRPAEGGRDLVGPRGIAAGHDVTGEILDGAEPVHHGPHLTEIEAGGAVGAHQHPAGIGATVPHRETVMAQQPSDRMASSVRSERFGRGVVVFDPAHFVQAEVGVLDGGPQPQRPPSAGLVHPGGKDVLPGALEPDQPAAIGVLRTGLRIAPAAARDQSGHVSPYRHRYPPFSNRDRIGRRPGRAAVPR